MVLTSCYIVSAWPLWIFARDGIFARDERKKTKHDKQTVGL